MNESEVKAILTAEIGSDWSRSNAHGIDLRACLVQPRRVVCKHVVAQPGQSSTIELWIVLEEMPGSRDGYLIVFDDDESEFGLAIWEDDSLVFLGYYGTFMQTLHAM